MMFKWFDELEFHFKEHDQIIQSRDQVTSSFKGHMHFNALRHNQVIMGSLFFLIKKRVVYFDWSLLD